jgi:RHS repeat-associated protein
VLDPIDLNSFYDALHWLKPARSQKLNSILHHLNIITEWTGAGTIVDVNMLFDYQPMDAIKWTEDVSGNYLKNFLHTDFSAENIRYVAEHYFNGVSLADPALYFSSNSSVWQYVFDAFQRNSYDPLLTDAISLYWYMTYPSLYVTEDMTHLTNYLKHYDPYYVLSYNYSHDELQSAFMGLLHYSPLQYAEELEAALGIDFGLQLGCSAHAVSLIPITHEVYGKRRLGISDATQSRKENDNSYSRILAKKTYELSDHLDNVVATVTDKKLHPQELMTLGSTNINSAIGYQPEISGRYDRYPYGMEIMSRSGDFTISDYTADEYTVVFQGMPSSCTAYSAPNANTSITDCSTITNAYNQTVVTSVSAGSSISMSDPIKIRIRPFISQVIPNLDLTKKYKIEIHLNNTWNRTAYARLDANSATFATSISAGSGASAAQIKAAGDKLITLEHTGAELQSYVNSTGSYIGQFLIEINAGSPPVNTLSSASIEVAEIVITQIDENVSVPLAQRDEAAYKYGFNGMERDDEVRGTGNSYEFANRSIYDSRLGRFVSVDISANKFPSLSPYAFAGNKPISHKDQDGEFAQLVIKYGVDVAINIATQMMMAYMFDDNVTSFEKAWESVSLLDAFGEGIVDQLGAKKIRMASNSVLGLFSYMDQVGVDNMNAQGVTIAMGIGLLEPIVGDAVMQYGTEAVAKGLRKLNIDPERIIKLLGTTDPVIEGSGVERLQTEINWIGGTENCVACAISMELRLSRNLNSSALNTVGDKNALNTIREVFPNALRVSTYGGTKGFTDKLSTMSNNSVIVLGYYKGANKGHAFNAVKGADGNWSFLDSQNGVEVNLEEFGRFDIITTD